MSYLPGTVLQGCRLFKWCQNLRANHFVAGLQAVKEESEPTCWALCCRGAVSLSGYGSYLLGTVLQCCRLFKWCLNLLAWHCVAGVQSVSLPMSEPTCGALCCRGAGCLSSVRTYLPGTVFQGCRLFKPCLKLPAGHCVAGVQAV